MLKTLLSALLIVASASVLTAKDKELPPAATKTGVTYDADIKPIFQQSCFKCHGAEKQKGKLRLDSLAAVLKGGGDGKILKAGDSAGSQLVKSVARVGDPDGFMPPEEKGKPLTAEQVGLIRAWIDQGAK